MVALNGLGADIAAGAAAGTAVLVAQTARHEQLPELAALRKRRQILPRLTAAALRAVLNDPFVLAGHLNHKCGLRECCASTVFRRAHLCPLRRPKFAMSECQWFGVAMETAFSSLSSSALRMSCSVVGTGRLEGVGRSASFGAFGSGFFLPAI